MCGITGAWSPQHLRELEDSIREMTSRLTHRGPDDSGYWSDGESGVVLGHRRLAVVDLTVEGHQPMVSPTGRYVLVYNGEIYNHQELRHLLALQSKEPNWRGHSDTETLLAAIDSWGLRTALERSTGMFALALWDRHDRTLSFARDRMGEKPLYYGLQAGSLLFGSELKSLRAAPRFRGEINRDAVALLLRKNYIPAPYSIYAGILKLPPGTLVTVSGRHIEIQQLPEPEPYWSLAEHAAKGQAEPFAGTDAEAIETLDGLLRGAVKQQMVADVPLGAFLSGGVDSSTIVALMQAQSSRPVRTFTIGFREGPFNEADDAKLVAEHLGTAHTELILTPAEAMAVIPRLPDIYDEPFSDSSQIPTLLVSELARSAVTVSLSGDGGDELFHGYQRYSQVSQAWQYLRLLPRSLRKSAGWVMRRIPVENWDSALALGTSRDTQAIAARLTGDRIHKLAALLPLASPADFYERMVTHWSESERVALGASKLPTTAPPVSWRAGRDADQLFSYLDMQSYLPGDILTKLDRASMAVSLESRVPLLDHKVVEFALTLPMSQKVRNGETKWVLRQVLYRNVPRQLIERPKKGFGVPLGQWLRGGLRQWAEDLLSEERIRRQGWLDPKPIREKWAEHLSGRRNWHYLLWDVLMFEAWLDKQGA